MASSAISHDQELSTQIPDMQELLLGVSADSDDSGLSDTEAIEVPVSADIDYQESLSTTLPHPTSHSSGSTSSQHYSLILPSPSSRPSHFSFNPAWYLDKAYSSVNSDGEEIQDSNSDDSEEGAIAESSVKKNKDRRKKKSAEKIKHQEEYKRQKREEMLKKTLQVEAYESANLYALCRKSRGHQVPTTFQLHPLDVQCILSNFTIQQVRNGLIIRDSRQRVLVHLFPLTTVSPQLIETLFSSFQEYDTSATFPNYNYTHKRQAY